MGTSPLSGRRCVLLLLLAAGCAGDGGRAPAGESAGWRVDTVPLASIGSIEGDTTQQLYQVTAAVRLADGTIVVGNRGTFQLRYYDAGGRFLHAAGRQGRGPGEFTSMASLATSGDTVFAYDYESRQLAAFDARGMLLRSIALQTPDSSLPPVFLGRLADGRIIASAFPTGRLAHSRAAGLRRDTLVLWLLDAEGAPVRALGEHAGPEQQVQFMSRGGVRQGVALSTYPFYRGFAAAVTRDRVYAGETDSARILVLDDSLRPLPSLRWTVTAALPPEDLLAQYERYELDRLQDRSLEPLIRREVPQIPLPDRLPLFSALVVDGDGALWVREFDPPWTGDSRWLVFIPGQASPVRVAAPRGLRITSAGRDWVLGVVEDELGVEYVRLYRLHRTVSR